MANSIKSNFVYNSLGTVSNLLFPLLTFPYVTRVLQAEGIGLVAFYSSIIGYITLFTGLGIPMYAIREIAKVRDNNKSLSKTTIEIIILNLLLNLVGYFAVGVICVTVPQVQSNIPLFLLLSSSMILTSIGCPWFYNGVEDFKYITICGILIKLIAIAFLFILVKTKEDIMLYAMYTVIGTLGNYVLNFLRLRKYISIKEISLKEIHPFSHVIPAFSVFIFSLITGVYLNLDKLMLGFLSDNSSVGYYTSASNLSHTLLTFVTSLSTVLLPRASNLLSKGKTDEFYDLSLKAYNMVLLMCFPICLGLIIMSPTVIHIFCGNTFEQAILTLKILSPIIMAIGISNLIGLQMLYPLGKIKIVTLSCFVGACVNVILNFCLIPILKQDGAAIATIAAEISITITQLIVVKKLIPTSFINKNLLKYLLTSVIMYVGCYSISLLKLPEILNLFIIPIVGVLIYVGLLVIQKDSLTLEIIDTCMKKLHFVYKTI